MMGRWLILWVTLGVGGLGATRTFADAVQPAQPEARGVVPAAKPAAEVTAPSGHGWMTIRDDRDQATMLLHLPPRSVGGDGDPPGTVRIAPGVGLQTDGLAFYGNRVWLAMVQEAGLRRVVTLSVARSLGGSWEYPPGRPEVLPPLPGRNELVGFVGTARGPIALLHARHDSAKPENESPWTLLRLGRGEWTELALPWGDVSEIPKMGSILRIISMDRGVALFIHSPGTEQYTIFRSEVPQFSTLVDGRPATESWTRETHSIQTAGEPGRLQFAPDDIYQVGDGRTSQLVAATWRADGGVGGGSQRGELELLALRDSRASVLARLTDVPREHRISPLNTNNSLAILWWEASPTAADGGAQRDPVPGSTSARRFKVVEVSAISGKELYRGDAQGGGVMSGNEFKVLAVAVLLLTTLVLLFALRAEPTSSLQLPDGFVPADPLRRIIAALADLVPGVVIAAFLVGIEPEAMLSPTVFIGPRAEPLAWVFALGITVLHCTIGEAMTGRSIGKALTGCEVAGFRRDKETGKTELSPVMVWQAIVRNLIRWFVPVFGILLLIDGGRRHPADAAAGTVVVVRIEEPEED